MIGCLPFRLARAPGRAMFLVVLSGSLLLAEGLGRWENAAASPRWWKWALLLPAAGGLLALAATGTLFAAQHPSDTSGRLWHQLGGWAWATLLLVAGALLLARWLAEPARRGRWGAALLLLVVVDPLDLRLQAAPAEPDQPRTASGSRRRRCSVRTLTGASCPGASPFSPRTGPGRSGWTRSSATTRWSSAPIRR